jgi:hypothetical protein
MISVMIPVMVTVFVLVPVMIVIMVSGQSQTAECQRHGHGQCCQPHASHKFLPPGAIVRRAFLRSRPLFSSRWSGSKSSDACADEIGCSPAIFF